MLCQASSLDHQCEVFTSVGMLAVFYTAQIDRRRSPAPLPAVHGHKMGAFHRLFF